MQCLSFGGLTLKYSKLSTGFLFSLWSSGFPFYLVFHWYNENCPRVARPRVGQGADHPLWTHIAIPIPPPMHRAATPRVPPTLSRVCSKVTRILQPDAPRGWPKAMAPPSMLTCREGELKSVLWTQADTCFIFSPSVMLANHPFKLNFHCKALE